MQNIEINIAKSLLDALKEKMDVERASFCTLVNMNIVDGEGILTILSNPNVMFDVLKKCFGENPYLRLFIRALRMFPYNPKKMLRLLERLLVFGERYNNVLLAKIELKRKLIFRIKFFVFIQGLVAGGILSASFIFPELFNFNFVWIIIVLILLGYITIFSVSSRLRYILSAIFGYENFSISIKELLIYLLSAILLSLAFGILFR